MYGKLFFSLPSNNAESLKHNEDKSSSADNRGNTPSRKVDGSQVSEKKGGRQQSTSNKSNKNVIGSRKTSVKGGEETTEGRGEIEHASTSVIMHLL